MRMEVQFRERFAGFSVAPARAGERAIVALSEFVSSEDGSEFLQRVEGLEVLFQQIPGCPPREAIASFVGAIAPDLSATILINEPSIAKMRINRAVEQGEPVSADDIIEVERIDLGISVPADSAIVCINSLGWRKSLFYDFGPLAIPPIVRTYDLERQLGLQHGYLMFQEHFRIDDAVWEELLRQGWFPFRYLPRSIVEKVLGAARAGWAIDELLDETAVLLRIDDALRRAISLFDRPALATHRDLFAHTVDRFGARDFKSVVALIYPRIEGMLRSIPDVDQGDHSSPSKLIDGVTARYEEHAGPWGLLLPARFRRYLDEVIFRKWHPPEDPTFASRHTVSHGVAPQEAFDRSAAAVGLLAAVQLALYVPAEEVSKDGPREG
jgi:hypothetical protein